MVFQCLSPFSMPCLIWFTVVSSCCNLVEYISQVKQTLLLNELNTLHSLKNSHKCLFVYTSLIIMIHTDRTIVTYMDSDKDIFPPSVCLFLRKNTKLEVLYCLTYEQNIFKELEKWSNIKEKQKLCFNHANIYLLCK